MYNCIFFQFLDGLLGRENLEKAASRDEYLQHILRLLNSQVSCDND